MKAIFRNIALLAAIVISPVGTAYATPITYNFTASGFSSANGSVVPNDTLAGSLTIDGATVTGIDLTIDSHTYTAGEVGYLPDWIVGGTATSVANAIGWGTTDFWLQGTFSNTPSFYDFYYSVDGVYDIFSTDTGTLTVASNVPEPISIALLALGLAALCVARRKKA